MNFARERAHELWGEIMPLLRRHWEEIAHYQDIKLEPDVQAYCAAEDANMLRCYTARDARVPYTNELVGYSIYFVRPNIHYSSSKQAVQDVLYLAPEYRGAKVGSGLIGYADEQLKAEGVQAVYHHVKLKQDFGPLLEHMGYELVDKVYGKRLDKWV